MADSYITVDTKGLDRLIARYRPELQERIRKILNDGSIIVQREMRLKAPQGVSQRGIRETIVYEVNNGYAVIRPSASYAIWVEKGRLPGKMPPWRAEWKGGEGFVRWADAHGIPPFVLARSIARKGTRPKWFVRESYRKTKPQVERYAAVQINKLVAELNRGK